MPTNDPKTTWEFDADLKKLNTKLDKLETDFKKLGSEGKKSGVESKSGYAELRSELTKVAGSLAALYTSYQLVKSSVGTAAEFQKLETRINNLYLSAEKGSKAFGEFKKVASTTPFQLKDVVAAGVQLKSFGLNAEKALKPTVDLAAFMDTTATEAAYSLGRAYAAGAGAADILRERGVLNLIKSFSGIEDLTKLKLPEFRKVLLATLQDPAAGIAGSTDALSKIYVGAISNMKDSLDLLSESIGKKFLPGLTKYAKTIEKLVRSTLPTEADQLRQEQAEFNALIGILQDANALQETRKNAIDELESKYKTYLGNLGLEKATTEDLANVLKNFNDQFERKINLAVQERALSTIRGKLTDATYDLFEAEKNLHKGQVDLYGIGMAQINQNEFAKANIESLKKKIVDLKKEEADLTEELKRQGLISEINTKATDNSTASTNKATEHTLKLNKTLKESLDILEKMAGSAAKEKNPIEKLVEGQEPKLASTAVRLHEIHDELDFSNITDDLQNTANMIEDLAGGMADAALSGEGMGDAIVSALKRIAAQLTALSAAFAVLQLIPGGSAFTGGFLPFISKGFGFSGGPATASNSQPQIVVKSALPGQEFYIQSVNKQQNIYERLKF